MILSGREALFCGMNGEIDIYHIQMGIRNEPKRAASLHPLLYVQMWNKNIAWERANPSLIF